MIGYDSMRHTLTRRAAQIKRLHSAYHLKLSSLDKTFRRGKTVSLQSHLNPLNRAPLNDSVPLCCRRRFRSQIYCDGVMFAIFTQFEEDICIVATIYLCV